MKSLLLLFVSYLSFAQITPYPYVKQGTSNKIEVTEVSFTPLQTIINITFTNRPNEVKGLYNELFGATTVGVCIDKNAFLRESGKNEKYPIMRAIGIPFCSNGRTTIKVDERISFELIFKRLPAGVEVFDFIEKNPLDTLINLTHGWNMYGIEAENPLQGQKTKIQKRQRIEPQKIDDLITPTVPTLYFVETSTELLPESILYLDSLIRTKTFRDAASIRLEGHTDNIGDFEKNYELSTQRAAFVKSLLATNGVHADNIETQGYSHLHLLTESTQPDLRKFNRRVEIKITSFPTELER